MGHNRTATVWGTARSQLIAAAHELLVEHFVAQRSRGEAMAAALAFLQPGTVAERAGVARSALYHHWGQPPDGVDDGLTPFQRFIGEVFESEWGEPLVDDAAALIEDFDGSFTDLVHAVTDLEFHRYDSDEGWASFCVSVALALYGGSTQVNLDEVLGQISATYDVVLADYELRPRAPLTSHDIAAVVMALLDGLLLQRMYGSTTPSPVVDWTHPDTGESQQWSRAAIAVQALVAGMVEPLDA